MPSPKDASQPTGGRIGAGSSADQAHKVQPGRTRSRQPVGQPVDWAAPLLGDLPGSSGGPRFEPADPSGSGLSRVFRSRRGISPRRLTAILGIGMIVVVLGAIVSVPAISHSPASTPSPTEIALATDTPTDSPTLSPSPSPSPTPVPTPEPRVGNPLDGTSFLAYTVRSGDTLIRIAESFGLSTTSLYWANSSLVKDPQLVKIGQTLYIPPVDGLTVTVKDGDTVQSIADKYGIDPNELVAANGMSDQLLVTGQLLLVPGADTPPLPVKQVPVPTPRPVNWFRKLVWPVVAHHNITQYFGCTGWPGEPRYGSCAHWHSGVDVGAPTGTAVVAAASGKVIYAGWRKRGTDGAAGGIVVWMSHGNGTLYTTYNHLSGVTVRIGQTVKAGQQVGKVGSTGASSGSHLHFEVWIAYPWTGGTYAEVRNPLLYTIYRP